MLVGLLVLAIPVSTIALLYARWEYRRRGELSPLGLLLLCAMILVPNLVLEYATRYEWPRTALDYAGIAVAIAGLALCLLGITRFRSMPKVLCIDAGELTTTGPYRWSRNPQYVGFFLLLVGFALTDWSLWCLAALVVAAVNLHLLVLVEEEHLRREFGDAYTDFSRQVPRYVGLGPLRI